MSNRINEAFENLYYGSDNLEDKRILCKAYGLLEEFEKSDPWDEDRILNKAVERYFGIFK